MIDHSECTHLSTPGARAKCRRARFKGEVLVGFQPPLYSLDARLSPKTTERSHEKERNRGSTPKDRDKQCDVCGVERIKWRGVDILSGLVLYVGSRCFYMVKRDPEGPVLVDKRG
jgi:hypothetical protein